MSSSKEVFALRKEGSLDEAYAMALEINQYDPNDEWNIKALAYCLNDLIKRAASNNDYNEAQAFAMQLDNLSIDEYDEILTKTVQKAKLIANPQKKIILDAKQLSFDGKDQEAYSLFKRAFEQFPDEPDLAKSYGWTIYKLLKKAIENKEVEKKVTLLLDYRGVELKIADAKLLQSMNYLKELADEERQIIRDAKEKSKSGNHDEALLLFREAVQRFPDDIDLHEQFAWELQKEGKLIFEKEKVDVQQARKLLSDYIKLKNSRPSQLHSLFLRFADKITDREEFKLISFLKLWDLNNLREEDFESFSKDGKTYPSIAEKIIQHGAKLILDKKMNEEVEYFTPFLDKGIQTFQDNIWLTYYKAKLLHLINRNQEAIEFLIPVVKEKISEYWTWNLLAELMMESDTEKALSCFCKSLLCKGEDKFLANVRTRFVELLIEREYFNEAKFEVTEAIKAKEAEAANVSERLRNYQKSHWYNSASTKANNIEFYNQHKRLAEELIFNSYPWLLGSIGESFVIPEKPDKPRRKIYIELPNGIIEVVISDRKFNTRNLKIGEAIRIKGEYDKDSIFQTYLLEKRDEKERFDLFEEHKGNVVQSIKNDSGRITGWRVALFLGEQMKEGIIDVTELKDRFQINEGTPVFVKYYQKAKPRQAFSFLPEKETRLDILEIKERTEGKFWDCFPEHVGIIDHINSEKGIAHFIISKKIDGVVKLHLIKGKVEIGSKLLVKLKKVTKDSESYYIVLTCSLTNQEPTENLLKPFSGMVELSGSVGFADDVYIDSNLIKESQIEDGIHVSGTAILNYNKKKRTWGWKAIRINN